MKESVTATVRKFERIMRNSQENKSSTLEIITVIVDIKQVHLLSYFLIHKINTYMFKYMFAIMKIFLHMLIILCVPINNQKLYRHKIGNNLSTIF